MKDCKLLMPLRLNTIKRMMLSYVREMLVMFSIFWKRVKLRLLKLEDPITNKLRS